MPMVTSARTGIKSRTLSFASSFLEPSNRMSFLFDQEEIRLVDLTGAIQYKEESLMAEERALRVMSHQLVSQESKLDYFEAIKEFIKLNWNMVLTPKILEQNRELILEQMKEVFGGMNGEIASLEDTSKRLEQFTYRFERDRYQMNLKESVISVVSFWRRKAERVKKIKSAIGKLMELRTGKYCEYCGGGNGLRCESLWVLEDIFNECCPKQEINEKTMRKWQNYFLEKCPVRTICYQCSEKIIENHKKNRKELNEEIKSIQYE